MRPLHCIEGTEERRTSLSRTDPELQLDKAERQDGHFGKFALPSA